MAAGPFIVPQLAHANMYNATGLLSPTLTLAKVLYKQHRRLWPNLDACRNSIRTRRGNNGDKIRHQSPPDLVRPNQPAGFTWSFPKSSAPDYSPFILDAERTKNERITRRQIREILLSHLTKHHERWVVGCHTVFVILFFVACVRLSCKFMDGNQAYVVHAFAT